MRRLGYTLIEVLMAMIVFSIALVPVSYILVDSAKGNAWGHDMDQALQLAQEEWGRVRQIPVDSLHDTTYDQTLSGKTWKVQRNVRGVRGDSIAQLGDSTASRKRPVEIGVCILREGLRNDTLHCWRWLRPRTMVSK